MIFKYKDRISELSQKTEVERHKLITQIKEFMLNCHSDSKEENWYNKFCEEIQNSFNKYESLKIKGLKEYVLMDFISQNKYLLQGRKTRRMIRESSMLECLNKKEFSTEYGDYILDYLDLNIVAYHDAELANEFIQIFDINFNDYKACRLFTLYTAKSLLDLIIRINSTQDINIIYSYKKFINFIFESFEDFTVSVPNWVKNKKRTIQE